MARLPIGLTSLDAERLAAGEVCGVAVGALIGGAVLSLIGGIGGLVVLMFCILGPDPPGGQVRPVVTDEVRSTPSTRSGRGMMTAAEVLAVSGSAAEVELCVRGGRFGQPPVRGWLSSPHRRSGQG